MGKKNAGVLICYKGSKEGILILTIKMMVVRQQVDRFRKDNK